MAMAFPEAAEQCPTIHALGELKKYLAETGGFA
jgi:hypothetical protein